MGGERGSQSGSSRRHSVVVVRAVEVNDALQPLEKILTEDDSGNYQSVNEVHGCDGKVYTDRQQIV